MLTLGPQHSTQFNIKNFYILLFCCFLLVFAIASQIFTSFYFNSLMLLASATHMLADFIFLLFSAIVVKLSSKPQSIQKTYGYARLEVLASFANGLILLIIASQILYSLLESNLEGILDFFTHNHAEHLGHDHAEHLGHDHEEPVVISHGHSHGPSLNSSNAKSVLYLSVFLLFINFIVSFCLYFAKKQNIKTTKNTLLLESTFLHMINDAFATLITLVGALIIIYTNYKYTDALFSVILCVLILRLSFKIIKKSGSILLDFTPKTINITDFKDYLEAKIPNCKSVFHIHIWSLNENEILANFSVLVDKSDNIDLLINDIKQEIKNKYNINHSFIEVKLHTDTNCSVIN